MRGFTEKLGRRLASRILPQRELCGTDGSGDALSSRWRRGVNRLSLSQGRTRCRPCCARWARRRRWVSARSGAVSGDSGRNRCGDRARLRGRLTSSRTTKRQSRGTILADCKLRIADFLIPIVPFLTLSASSALWVSLPIRNAQCKCTRLDTDEGFSSCLLSPVSYLLPPASCLRLLE
jgi:hypothetical protein